MRLRPRLSRRRSEPGRYSSFWIIASTWSVPWRGWQKRSCGCVRMLQSLRQVAKSYEFGGEYTYRVGPLSVPPMGQAALADAIDHSAVQLFVARMKALHETFSPNPENLVPICTICRRLDGIPLAIELAAARAALLGPQVVASSLDNRFQLLTGGRRTALPRHQALRATLDWSYDLLPAVERCVLRRLAIFAGAFSLDEACAVAVGGGVAEPDLIDYIGNLAAKSLVTVSLDNAVVPYRLLETTRIYALEKLSESGEIGEIAQRHAQCYRDLFERAEKAWATGPTRESAARYFWHIDELRTALDWAFSPNGDTSIGVALTLAAVPLWMHFSLLGSAAGVSRVRSLFCPNQATNRAQRCDYRKPWRFHFCTPGGAHTRFRSPGDGHLKSPEPFTTGNIWFVHLKAFGCWPLIAAGFRRR